MKKGNEGSCFRFGESVTCPLLPLKEEDESIGFFNDRWVMASLSLNM